ncbi:hypothetical protein OH492_26455 [Vibrio chagasii]|nr:hypothetical protein [Vibrio chagasii]
MLILSLPFFLGQILARYATPFDRTECYRKRYQSRVRSYFVQRSLNAALLPTFGRDNSGSLSGVAGSISNTSIAALAWYLSEFVKQGFWFD